MTDSPKAVVTAGAPLRPLIPTDIESGWRLATAFAKSQMLPKSYYDGKGDPVSKAFTAMQMGAEVGLNPLNAIQSIAVINGMATIWGDTQKALVLSSGKAEYIHEGFSEGEAITNGKPNPSFYAWCETSRNGVVTKWQFSVQDAMDAGLWGKDLYKKYPKRMMMYKARAYVLRDAYPDVLKGLSHSYEEVKVDMVDVTPAQQITPHNPAEGLADAISKKDAEPAAIEAPKEEPVDLPTDGDKPEVVYDMPEEVARAGLAMPAEEPEPLDADSEYVPEQLAPQDADPEPEPEPKKEGDITGLEYSIRHYQLTTKKGLEAAANGMVSVLLRFKKAEREEAFNGLDGETLVQKMEAAGVAVPDLIQSIINK